MGVCSAVSLAERAPVLHPRFADDEVEMVIDQISRLLYRFASRIIAKVLRFPPSEMFDRRPIGPRLNCHRSGGWHHWETLEGGRARCLHCLQLPGGNASNLYGPLMDSPLLLPRPSEPSAYPQGLK